MKVFKKYTMLMLLLSLTFACKKFVEVDPPKNKLVTASVFINDDTAITALTAIYNQMMNSEFFPYKISLFTGLAGDELFNFSTEQGNVQLYQGAIQPLDAPTNNIWTLSYNMIYQANGVYEGCDQSSTLSAPVKKQLMAEARFIRAFWYFYLVNLYGDIPLLTSTDYASNAVASRTPSAQVYQQIITDLKYSEANLNENYVLGNTTGTGTDRIRPNKYAAAALLARTYLYTKSYTDAETEASTVISNTNKYSLVDVTKVFLANNNEAIFQLPETPPNNSNVNTWEGAYYFITTKPASNLQNSSTLSTSLMNAFDLTDKRKINWIGQSTSGGVTYYFPYKYKVVTGSSPTEFSTVLRLGETYLIRAEARAQQNNLSGAIGDTDMIRGRAGITLIATVNPNISKDDLLQAIATERQKELFTEYGHRWMDLKRTGKIDLAMVPAYVAKGFTWNTNRQLWPIPLTDIQNDKSLVQNTGYN